MISGLIALFFMVSTTLDAHLPSERVHPRFAGEGEGWWGWHDCTHISFIGRYCKCFQLPVSTMDYPVCYRLLTLMGCHACRCDGHVIRISIVIRDSCNVQVIWLLCSPIFADALTITWLLVNKSSVIWYAEECMMLSSCPLWWCFWHPKSRFLMLALGRHHL